MKMTMLSTLFAALTIAVGEPVSAQEDLQLDGMAVVGNRELPKALFIVPWKAPDAAVAPDRPVNTLINEALQPVDPDVFRRQLEYFETVHRLD